MATFQTKLMNMAESISNKLSYFNALDHLRHVSNQTIVMLEKFLLEPSLISCTFVILVYNQTSVMWHHMKQSPHVWQSDVIEVPNLCSLHHCNLSPPRPPFCKSQWPVFIVLHMYQSVSESRTT